jgi:hypothetical protein
MKEFDEKETSPNLPYPNIVGFAHNSNTDSKSLSRCRNESSGS